MSDSFCAVRPRYPIPRRSAHGLAMNAAPDTRSCLLYNAVFALEGRQSLKLCFPPSDPGEKCSRWPAGVGKSGSGAQDCITTASTLILPITRLCRVSQINQLFPLFISLIRPSIWPPFRQSQPCFLKSRYSCPFTWAILQPCSKAGLPF